MMELIMMYRHVSTEAQNGQTKHRLFTFLHCPPQFPDMLGAQEKFKLVIIYNLTTTDIYTWTMIMDYDPTLCSLKYILFGRSGPFSSMTHKTLLLDCVCLLRSGAVHVCWYDVFIGAEMCCSVLHLWTATVVSICTGFGWLSAPRQFILRVSHVLSAIWSMWKTRAHTAVVISTGTSL